jgi:hypothetical protein
LARTPVRHAGGQLCSAARQRQKPALTRSGKLQASLRDAWLNGGDDPGVETPGYHQPSLRDAARCETPSTAGLGPLAGKARERASRSTNCADSFCAFRVNGPGDAPIGDREWHSRPTCGGWTAVCAPRGAMQSIFGGKHRLSMKNGLRSAVQIVRTKDGRVDLVCEWRAGALRARRCRACHAHVIWMNGIAVEVGA